MATEEYKLQKPTNFDLLDHLQRSGYFMYSTVSLAFKIATFCLQSAFCVDLKTNIDYFFVQY